MAIRATASGSVSTTVVTDSAGRFHVLLPPGRYSVTAERIGLQQLLPVFVDVPPRGTVEVAITMSDRPVGVSALTVVATSRRLSRTAEIEERIRSARALGLGSTMTREQIEARGADNVVQLVASAAPGITIIPAGIDRNALKFRRGNCEPAVFIDGIQINRRPSNPAYLVEPEELVAVEVYKGAAQMRDYFDPTGCGTILFWTKRGEEQGPSRVSWKRIGIAAALVSLLLIAY